MLLCKVSATRQIVRIFLELGNITRPFIDTTLTRYLTIPPVYWNPMGSVCCLLMFRAASQSTAVWTSNSLADVHYYSLKYIHIVL